MKANGNEYLSLRVLGGPCGGMELPMPPAPPRTFGCDAPAEIRMAWDRTLGAPHFWVGVVDGHWQAGDLQTQLATTVNHLPCNGGLALQDGDVIRAGSTLLQVRIGRRLTRYENVIHSLRGGGAPLYAVLDAARDPGILALLGQSGLPYVSLFAGPRSGELAAVAPYLVHLPVESPLLVSLVHNGWGNAWGIYLNSTVSPDVLRRGLRSLLLAVMDDEATGNGRRMLFRFYDPRVMRVWLQTGEWDTLAALFRCSTVVRLEADGGDSMMTATAEGCRIDPMVTERGNSHS